MLSCVFIFSCRECHKNESAVRRAPILVLVDFELWLLVSGFRCRQSRAVDQHMTKAGHIHSSFGPRALLVDPNLFDWPMPGLCTCRPMPVIPPSCRHQNSCFLRYLLFVVFCFYIHAFCLFSWHCLPTSLLVEHWNDMGACWPKVFKIHPQGWPL